jgi:phytoene synthase
MRISIARPESPAAIASQATALIAAERYCAELARREAKNFYWGFIALPHQKRMAIYALYDFARQVDDEADLGAAGDPRLRLTAHRERLRRCLAGDASDPVTLVLSRAIRSYGIPAGELEQIIDGVESDLLCRRYATWKDLRSYCSAVASSVGRICVRIFGFSDPRALEFADDLGAAMQLTNILRDVREDLALNRLYFPLDELSAYGLTETGLRQAVDDRQPDSLEGWDRFVDFQVERARQLYRSGLRVVRFIPSSSATCVLTMAGIYQRVLGIIGNDPFRVLRQRVALSKRAKSRIMVGSWLKALSR